MRYRWFTKDKRSVCYPRFPSTRHDDAARACCVIFLAPTKRWHGVPMALPPGIYARGDACRGTIRDPEPRASIRYLLYLRLGEPIHAAVSNPPLDEKTPSQKTNVLYCRVYWYNMDYGQEYEKKIQLNSHEEQLYFSFLGGSVIIFFHLICEASTTCSRRIRVLQLK